VLTACYVARTYGVRSAMPMFQARKLCPLAAVVPPDMAKYARVGREVRGLMRDLTPLVEPVSVDEAFMDLSGTERLHGMYPAKSLAGFAARVERELGHHGVDRTLLQQVPRQDRIRPRQAARLCRARRHRSGGPSLPHAR